MATREDKLRAKVKATNAANAEANRLESELKTYFAQFVGKKILKKDESLLAAIAASMPSLPNRHDLRCHRERSSYTLYFQVTASTALPDGSCMYAKSSVPVGDVRAQDGVLVCVNPFHSLRTDYTFEEIQAKRDKVAEAKKVLDDARSELYPFDEYDR